MEITFLGTSCMIPTKERNHVGALVRYKNEGILIDCGEGIQRQIKIAGMKLTTVTKILISHWHGDHVLGIAGLIASLGASEYCKELEIYGPRGTEERIRKIFEAFVFENRIQMRIQEVEEGKFYDGKDLELWAFPLEHGPRTLAYRIVEKDRRKIIMAKAQKLGLREGPLIGKLQNGEEVAFKGQKITPDDVSTAVKGRKIAFVLDTVPCKGSLEAAREADVAVIEASYSSKLKDKAEEYRHMTAKEAAQIASTANAKKLVLTHFSARYKDTTEIEEDAKEVFPNTVCAKDFMRVKV